MSSRASAAAAASAGLCLLVLSVTTAGCGADAASDDAATASEQADTAQAKATYTRALGAMGLRRVGTTAIAYSADTGVPSEIVCDPAQAGDAGACSERVCRGDAARGTRYCFPIVYEGGGFQVKGSATRFESDGGLVAIVIGADERMVGPVARGRQTVTLGSGATQVAATIDVHDVTVTDHGDVVVNAALEIPGRPPQPDAQLTFDTDRSSFAANDVVVGFDVETGLARSLAFQGAPAAPRASTVLTDANGAKLAELGAAVRRLYLPWFDPNSKGAGARCPGDVGLVVDVVAQSDASMQVRLRYASGVVRAPNGAVLAVGGDRASDASGAFVKYSLSPPFVNFSRPNNPYSRLVFDGGVLVRTEGFAGYGWPYYLSDFPVDKSCVVVPFD